MPPKTNEQKKAQPQQPRKTEKKKVTTYGTLEKYLSSKYYKRLKAQLPVIDLSHPLQHKDVETVITNLDLAFRHAGRKDIDIDVAHAMTTLHDVLSEVEEAEAKALRGDFSSSMGFWSTMSNFFVSIGMNNNFIKYLHDEFMYRENYSMENMKYFREILSSMIVWRIEDPYGSWEDWWGVAKAKKEAQKDINKNAKKVNRPTANDKFTELAGSILIHQKQVSLTLSEEANTIAKIVADSWTYNVDEKMTPDKIHKTRYELQEKLTTLFEYKQGITPCTKADLSNLYNDIEYLFPKTTATWMPLFSYLQSAQTKTPGELTEYIQNYALGRLKQFLDEKDIPNSFKDATLDNIYGEVSSDPDDIPFKSEEELEQYTQTIQQCYRLVSEKTNAFFDSHEHIKSIKQLREYATNHKALLDSIEKELQGGHDRLRTLSGISADMRSMDYTVENDLNDHLYAEIRGNRAFDDKDRPFPARQLIAKKLKVYAAFPKQRLTEIVTDILKDAVKENYNSWTRDLKELEKNNHMVEYAAKMGLLTYQKGDGTVISREPLMEKSLKDLQTWLYQSSDTLGKIERDGKNEKFIPHLKPDDSKTVRFLLDAKNGLKYLQYVAQRSGLKNLFSQPLSDRGSITKDLIYFKDFLYANGKLVDDVKAINAELLTQNETDKGKDWTAPELTSSQLGIAHDKRRSLASRAANIKELVTAFRDKGIVASGLDTEFQHTVDALGTLNKTISTLDAEFKRKTELESRRIKDMHAKIKQFSQEYLALKRETELIIAKDPTRDWSKFATSDDLAKERDKRQEWIKAADNLVSIAEELIKNGYASDQIKDNFTHTKSIRESLNAAIEKIQPEIQNKSEIEAMNNEQKFVYLSKQMQDDATKISAENKKWFENERKIREYQHRLDTAPICLNYEKNYDTIRKNYLPSQDEVKKHGYTLSLINAICNELKKDPSSRHDEYKNLIETVKTVSSYLNGGFDFHNDPSLLSDDAKYEGYEKKLLELFIDRDFKMSLKNLYMCCAKYLNIHLGSEPADAPDAAPKKTLTGQWSESGRIRKQAAVAIMSLLHEAKFTHRLIEDAKGIGGLDGTNVNENYYPITVQDLTDLKDSLSKGSHGPENYHGKSNPFYELYSPIAAARNQKLRKQKESEQRAREQERKAQERLEKEQRKNAKKKNAKKS